ncbi:hypothetical protein FRC01_012970 [Tulasnella sp. 417]|nr:hypothetical protein FRC01_012970 [Tulasnella sp. 417]
MESGLSDSRPSINLSVREWAEKATGITIPDLEPSFSPPDPASGLLFGDLGDHRWGELTTAPTFPHILVPARKGFCKPLEDELYDIKGTSPVSVETFQTADQAFHQQVRGCLAGGRPCQVIQEPPPLLKEMRLRLGNAAAESISSLSEMVEVHNGHWSKISRELVSAPHRWETFLGLGNHPGAFWWTQVRHTGQCPKPKIVQWVFRFPGLAVDDLHPYHRADSSTIQD